MIGKRKESTAEIEEDELPPAKKFVNREWTFTRRRKKLGFVMEHKEAPIDVGTSEFDLIGSPPPEIDWWDDQLVSNDAIDSMIERAEIIFALSPIYRPGRRVQEYSMPMTDQERKKLRRRKAVEKQRIISEKVRAGLIPPPRPRVTLSNLMKVLAQNQVADPSLVETQVRAQIEERQLRHTLYIEKNRLTPSQRRAKLRKKLREDTSDQVFVAVFKLQDLVAKRNKYKLQVNAVQYNLSGALIQCEEGTVCIVEGGKRGIKRFKRLMIHRIRWDGIDADIEYVNNCGLVWYGTKSRRNFSGFTTENCRFSFEKAFAYTKTRDSHQYLYLAKQIPFKDIPREFVSETHKSEL